MPPVLTARWFPSSAAATGHSKVTEREKIHAGVLYQPNDPTIMAEQLAYLDMMNAYNATSRLDSQKRAELLKKIFAEVGENCYVESPYFGNWAGHHVYLGSPCRVQREIGERDRMFYHQNRRIYHEFFQK